MVEPRFQREQEFHDQRFAKPEFRERKVNRFYKITEAICQEYQKFLLHNCEGLRVIEYGCGMGSYAFMLAINGANSVTGIDISPVAINIAEVKAREEGMDQNLSFKVMNAEDLKFDEYSVDLICGSGILHHLDIEKALDSIVRVLQPQGKAIFVEPLGHNLFINLFRKLTPNIRSEDEHPLLDQDLLLLKKYFLNVEIHYFYLTSLGASLFVDFPGFKVLLSYLESLDKMLFKLPFLRKQAWQVLIKLGEPIRRSE